MYREDCFPDYRQHVYRKVLPNFDVKIFEGCEGFGPFIPLVEPARNVLTVASCDTSMGQGSGTAYCHDSAEVQISATPRYGYRFTQWDDGDTANPRRVVVVSDTTFTACFARDTFYTLTVTSNNDAWGVVFGGGRYAEGWPVTVRARPLPGYTFERWSDSVWPDTRLVTLTSDTVLQAIFRPEVDSSAILSRDSTISRDSTRLTALEAVEGEQVDFTLAPNPSGGRVEVRITNFESRRYDYRRAAIVVLDVPGHEVYRTPLLRPVMVIEGLPEGVYFVTVVTPQGSATRRLVVTQ